jgi:hypothetical protein
MLSRHRWAGGPLLVVLAGLTFAAPAPPPKEETVKDKDRAGFIPKNKYEPLPGQAVGVLVANVRDVMANDDRSGPPDALGFSRGGGSYRWVYVPAEGKAILTGLQVATGEKGGGRKLYPKLNMADPKTVKQWEITMPAAVLVEVEVNDGLGAPADQSFVATKMKVVEGTREFPLKVADTLAAMRKRYEAYLKEQDRAIEEGMTKAQKEALKDQKPTGPREKSELVYLSWLPQTERLVVRFRLRITDGAYQYGGGAAPGPFPLPVPPGPPRKEDKQAPAPVPETPRAPPPPPPRGMGARWGTSFGVELGVGYEVSKDGSVATIEVLPPETFKQVLPPPPGPLRFPVDPLPPRKP